MFLITLFIFYKGHHEIGHMASLNFPQNFHRYVPYFFQMDEWILVKFILILQVFHVNFQVMLNRSHTEKIHLPWICLLFSEASICCVLIFSQKLDMSLIRCPLWNIKSVFSYNKNIDVQHKRHNTISMVGKPLPKSQLPQPRHWGQTGSTSIWLGRWQRFILERSGNARWRRSRWLRKYWREGAPRHAFVLPTVVFKCLEGGEGGTKGKKEKSPIPTGSHVQGTMGQNLFLSKKASSYQVRIYLSISMCQRHNNLTSRERWIPEEENGRRVNVNAKRRKCRIKGQSPGSWSRVLGWMLPKDCLVEKQPRMSIPQALLDVTGSRSCHWFFKLFLIRFTPGVFQAGVSLFAALNFKQRTGARRRRIFPSARGQ